MKCLAQPEELPHGYPDIEAAIILSSRIEVELANEGFEHGDVVPRAKAQGGRRD